MIKIGLASPDMIRSWSHGEVKKPETINYRTLKPERDGLYCERIFGPSKDWECHCGKYKKIRYKGKICERCGVEVTSKKVRRERMGHIELASPVAHIWYSRGFPSRIGLVLDMSPRVLEKIIYFANYVVTDPGDTPLMEKQILNEKDYRELREKYEDDFEAGIGAEAIRKLLEKIDLDKLSESIREELKDAMGQKKLRLIKRLESVEAFRLSGNRPEWMILQTVPVIPPDLRPMVQLDGGRFATSDLNDLYRRVINRNNRLKRLLELNAPEIIVRNEKRMLQEAVDALFDNGRRGRPVTGPNNRSLKSLSDMLKGKQGRFRQNLLGKRVDYSGRSVIVVGPELKIYQCGLPKEMALELFKPFVMKKLGSDGLANNIKSAKKMVERARTEVWDALEDVIKEHPVLLNRAPTLHRLGIQAFEPVLVEGRAIKLHPLVCTAFNADFDGDQMAVHVPLSAEAQAEARFLMLSANNLLKPADGRPVTVPTQDMVLGCYYLTITREEEGTGKIFGSFDEVVLAYDNKVIGIHSPIKVRRTGEIGGKTVSRLVDCTMGQIIFNEKVPQSLGFVDRENPETFLDLEITTPCGKSLLGKILGKCIDRFGFARTAEVMDNIKALGFKYSTQGALTFSVSDIIVPQKKYELVAETEKKIIKIENQFKRGFITNDERKRLAIREWEKTTDDVTNALRDGFDRYNPIWMMLDSGARGSMNQLRQLAGMRGNISNTAGQTIEIPIKANYREGLTVLEYFVAARGARKGLADTALRTADSGYLTRRLVDVSQSVIVREEDCGTKKGIMVSEIADTQSVIEPFRNRLLGRYLVNDLLDPETGEILVSKDKLMDERDADRIIAKGITAVETRSILACRSTVGVCAKCYGSNLATGEPIGIGEAVGIIAAQSIGEPGTQLTMRTFHTGGIAGHDVQDITQGLPRVEELFEARKPKRTAVLSDIAGVVQIRETKKPTMRDIVVTDAEGGETRVYQVPVSAGIKVAEGEVIERGHELTEGAFAPQDILRTRGPEAVEAYIIQEVQRAYSQQGVDINDKHIEVIIRQMMNKVRIEQNGSSDLLVGASVDHNEVLRLNEELQAKIDAGEKDENGEEYRLVEYSPTLLGITKASLATDSFLSAASFQETTRVLTEAAIRGKVDPLIGLKENVIIGKLIPAGSGLQCYMPEEDADEDVYPEPSRANREAQEREKDEDDIGFDDDIAENAEREDEADDFDVQNAETEE